MWFSDQESSNPVRQLMLWLWLAGVVIFIGVSMDPALQANGIYGARTFAVETVTRKELRRGSRKSRTPVLYLQHRGEFLKARVTREQYDTITVGERLKVIIVRPITGSAVVFLDRPGIKHTLASRTATFCLVIGINFTVLFLFFKFLLARARQREQANTSAFPVRRLGAS